MSIISSMTTFQTLPNELLMEIAGHLEDTDLNSLSRTSRKLHSISNPMLYVLASRIHPHLLSWACEVGATAVVQKLLAAGSSPNLPAFLPLSPDLYNFNGPPGCPLDILENIYGHDWWKRRINSGVIIARDNIKIYDPELHPIPGRYIWLTYSYWFPLHAAVQSGSAEIVKLLVNSGSHLDLPSNMLCSCRANGITSPQERGQAGCWTPLHAALCSGDEAMANLLLSLGASPGIELLTGQSNALHWAARAGFISTIHLLIEDLHVPDGATPLMWALGTKSSVKTMDCLIQHGADLEARITITHNDCRQPTAISQALANTWTEDAKYLIDAGANINPIPPFGYSALDYCLFASGITFRDEEIWQYRQLYSCGKSFQDHLARHQECEYNVGLLAHRPAPGVPPPAKKITKSEVFTTLVQKGAHLLDLSLIRASKHHNLALVKYLIDQGARVNAENGNQLGLFPLLAAVSHRSLENAKSPHDTIDYLLKHGAYPNKQNRFGQSALMEICSRIERSPKQLKIIKLLFRYGLDPNISHPRPSPPWHFSYWSPASITAFQAAFCMWKEDICRYLMEKGAEISHERGDLRHMIEFRALHGAYHQSLDGIKNCPHDQELENLPDGEERERPRNPGDDFTQSRADCDRCAPLCYLLEIDHDRWLANDQESFWLARCTWWFPMAECLIDRGAPSSFWTSNPWNLL
ncbi:ankyrin [Annulohypoxylon maeteangense]|uniref:ankyrin n=1 Tax=Annulohypoxylon maeteangense TaxID=1927788 RepID=UPI0020082D22|nr:ankyrin [Annulohypoxylon maeteangense]KAI0881318.1 ankyrin [Annulohypoxylon maeteangense]